MLFVVGRFGFHLGYMSGLFQNKSRVSVYRQPVPTRNRFP
jgi:hypothetical protein